uniref:fibronectin type III domain-containing protein n=1 Tax=Flavobacterium sp. TaxID=239 RepID=UPI0026039541
MRTKITLLAILAFLFSISTVSAQCTSGTLQNSQAYTPTLSATSQIAGYNALPGQYNNIVILPNRIYEFYSAVATDYITITNADASVVIAQGTGHLFWTTQGTGNIRYYIHKNAACGTDTVVRHAYMSCYVYNSCAVLPIDVLISNITSNSARLSWTNPSPAPLDDYDFYLSTSPTAPLPGTTPTLKATNYSDTPLTGLLSGTTYYYSIRSNCGSTRSAWSPVQSFTTNAFQSCNGAVNGTNFDTFTPPLTGVFTAMSTRSPGQFERVRVVNNAAYRFQTNLTTDYITVTNDAGNVVYATGTGIVNWTSGASAESIRVYMHSNSSCGVTTALGESTKWIRCTPSASSCIYPTGVTPSNITSNAVKISWTAPTINPSGSYDLYVGTNAAAPTSGTATLSLTTNVYDATGLQPNTQYYIWVRSNCGATTSQWVGGQSFTTSVSAACNGASYGLYPATTFVPSCTGSAQQIVSDAKAGQYSNVTVTANTQYTFSSSVVTDFITLTNSSGAVLLSGTTPLTWISGPSAGTLRFFVHSNNACAEQNVSRAKSVACSAVTSCGLPTDLAVSEISSGYARISWTEAASRPGGYDIYFTLSSTSVPTAATTPSATSTTNSAMVTLTNGSNTWRYWVRSNCGSLKGEWVFGGSFTNPVSSPCNSAVYGLFPKETFTPLCNGTLEVVTQGAHSGEYSNVNIVPYKNYIFDSTMNDVVTITNEAGTIVYAKSNVPLIWASENFSGVVRYFFHTSAGCGTDSWTRTKYIIGTNATTCNGPTALTVSNVTSNSARIAWTAPTYPPLGGYEVYYSTVNTAPTASTPATFGNATTISLAYNLSPATTYYYWVRSNCDGTIKGSWISGGSFTTIAFSSCNGASYGLYPEATYTPAGTGLAEAAFDSFAGQYSNFNAVTNRHYIFTTSVSTDYITITNAAGTVVYASGLMPLTWNSGTTTSGVLRYYVHTNASCGTQNTARTKYITCTFSGNCGGTVSGMTVSNLTSNSARISWTAPVSTPTGYEMYWSTSNAAPPAPISSFTPLTNATVGDLASGTTYYYWVRTRCDSNGTKGPWTVITFTTLQPLLCNGANQGINPTATFTPLETMAPEVVTTTSYAGQFSNINTLAKRDYTFTSSVPTDFITITNAAGTVVFASGTTPLQWSSGTTSGVVRFYVHTDAACGSNPSYRTTSITTIPPQILNAGDIVVVGAGADTGTATQSADEFSWMPLTDLRAGTQFYITDAGWNTASNQFMCTDNTEDILFRFTVPAGGIPAGSVQIVSQNGTDGNYEVISGTQCGSDADGKLTFANSGDQVVFFRSDAPINSSFPGTNFTSIYALTTATNNWSSLTTATASIAAGLRDNYSNLPPGLTNGLTALAVGLGSGVQNETDNARYEGPTSGIRQYLLAQVGTLSNWKRYDNGAGAEFPDFSGSNPVYGWTANGIASYTLEYCNPPMSITSSLSTYHSVRISWTAPLVAPANGYQVYYTTVAGVPSASIPVTNATTNTYYDIDGLTSGTIYRIWVRSVCGTNPPVGDWMDGGTYTPPAPGCTNGGLSPQNTFTPNCDGGSQVITVSALAGEYSNVNIQSDRSYIFSTTRATDFITITNSTGSTVYAYGTTPLTWYSASRTGTIRYYIHKSDLCTNDFTIRTKMIACQTPGTCSPPHYLTATDITSQTVKISWGEPPFPPEGGSQVYVSTVNTAPSINLPTTANATTGNFLSINGLTSATVYYYWVRSICFGSGFNWVYGGTFTTKFPGCTNGSLYPQDTFTPSCTGRQPITGVAYAGEYSNVNVTENEYTFSSSNASDYITITNADATQVLAYGNTPLVWESGFEGTIRYYLHTDFACGAQAANRTRWIACGEAAPCAPPTDLSVVTSTLTSERVELTWNSVTGVQLYISTQNVTPSLSEPYNDPYGQTGTTLNGLTPDTTYYTWIRSACDGNFSEWISGPAFSTLPTVSPGCNGATYGLYPQATYFPQCTGSQELISSSSWAGEFSNVAIAAHKQYTFESSVATDFITITNANGTVLLASGITPVVWDSGDYSGTIRYHFNLDANCGHINVIRSRFITCEVPPCITTSSEEISACDSYTWHEVTYTASGDYTYQSTDVDTGCVNTATLHLTINTGTDTFENATACDSYTWHGTTYTETGVYTYESTTEAGCISTATLNLRIDYNTASEETAVACSEYYWNGQQYYESGDYTYTTPNDSGCTHTATLHLTIHHSTQFEEEVFACDSYSVEFQTFTESGVYGVETYNEFGCLQYGTIYLTIGHSSTSEETVTACDSYEWNGQTYTESGDYTFESTNATGCTNTATLHLTINRSTTSSEVVVACESYTWNGVTYTDSGDYVYQSINDSGCSAVSRLYLTINHNSATEEFATACDGYEWNGQLYTSSGDYQHESQNDSGCTNLAMLHLTINNSTTTEENAVACDYYDWNGTTYTESGDYIFEGINDAGCTNVATLHLTVNRSTATSEEVAACNAYNWNGITYTESGNYTFESANEFGCTNTATLHLIINKDTNTEEYVTACDAYEWNLETYNESGDYSFTAMNESGCTNVATLHLTITHSSETWENVTACESYNWNGNQYFLSGDYTYSSINGEGCNNTAHLHLVINNDAIVTQPAPVSLCGAEASTATFLVGTNAVSAAYSWQYKEPSGAWTTITSDSGAIYSGYDSPSLIVTRMGGLPVSGTQFRAIVTSDCATLTSEGAVLSIPASINAGTVIAESMFCAGNDVVFTLTGYSGTSIQWQSAPSMNDSFTDIPGATSAIYTIPAINVFSNKAYRAVVSDAVCGTNTTTAIKTIKVNAQPVAGVITGGGPVCAGDSGLVKVTGYGGTIQWEYSIDGFNFQAAPTAATATPGLAFGTASTSISTPNYLLTNIQGQVY